VLDELLAPPTPEDVAVALESVELVDAVEVSPLVFVLVSLALLAVLALLEPGAPPIPLLVELAPLATLDVTPTAGLDVEPSPAAVAIAWPSCPSSFGSVAHAGPHAPKPAAVPTNNASVAGAEPARKRIESMRVSTTAHRSPLRLPSPST
jgi:hypothetical protein